ncbi:SNF2-related protein [Nitrosomonas sp.]|uniref:SNF2-related protein n=1 Tax=Nitrosomonas sp. TaxID=42353 RepID=UPI00374D5F73
MFDWIKRRNIENDAVAALRFQLEFEEHGLRWIRVSTETLSNCGPLAAPILEQLESDGLAMIEGDGYFSDWTNAYVITGHNEYHQVMSEIAIPPITVISPSLESIGALTDSDFSIGISGWKRTDGTSVLTEQLVGPVYRVDGTAKLIPEASWKVLSQVIGICQRQTEERTEIVNRQTWGQIRQTAIQAGSHLDDFLYRSIVITPEKLFIDLNRVDVNGMKVVEVTPSFPGCPPQWLDQFDRSSSVPDRFDIPTADGVVQIILGSAVKSVLQQVKKMPGRRVSGVRAEAFVINPFAALGEDAAQAIDPEQFESARNLSNLGFERFSAYIERDPRGTPIVIGLLIETGKLDTDGHPVSLLETFSSDEEIEKFIKQTKSRLEGGLQLSAWRDYEFELFGDTALELNALQEAVGARRRGYVLVSYSQVYDLTSYSSRIEEIGAQKPYYSPYIAKKDEEAGWFPENVVPAIGWVPKDDGEITAVPFSQEMKEQIQKMLKAAIELGNGQIEIPGLPRPIPIDEANRIIQAIIAFQASQAENPNTPIDKIIEDDAKTSRKATPTLVIKANIESIDYEESRRELLSTYSDSPRVPGSLKKHVLLKDHQKTGIAWMQHLFSLSPDKCRGAVLADDMGLGKTLQLLSFLASAFESEPNLEPALIIAPVSLLENWQEEIRNFFMEGSLPVATVYGENLQSLRLSKSAIDKQLLDEGLVKFLHPNWIGNAKIVLTTYETLRDLEFSFAAIRWSVMICDEAQKIKNPNALVTRAAKKQNVRFKIACTGTPVENTLADLWCLFDFVQPGILGALNAFGTRYRRPIEAKTDEEKQRVDELREIISAQILRRTKKDVAKDLPAKIMAEECRSLSISSYQLDLYYQALELFNKRNEPGARTPFKNHLGLLQYLRVVCTDPRAIGSESSTVDSLDDYRAKSPKLDWLVKTLAEIKKQDEKAIVFCEFRGMQRLLKHYIKNAIGFEADIINGDSAASASHQFSRQKRIKAFQEKPGFGVIILSPIAVGFGVNIQAANHVIHYTRTWNPAKEDQATDRAYRIGQTKDVFVYYPVVTAPDFTTFDVKLNQLLEHKRELSEDMLNGAGDIGLGEFNVTDVVPKNVSALLNKAITIDDVATLAPKYLEGFAAALWKSKGFSKVFRTPDSGDDGVDVVAINGNAGVLIQCKSSTESRREFSWDAVKDVVTGLASYRRRYPGIEFELVCLTNQQFNIKARDQARLNNVLLINQQDIVQLLNQHTITFSAIEGFVFNTWAEAIENAVFERMVSHEG